MPASVEFHTGVAEPVAFACRLLRKAYRAGARVWVTAPAERLAALDAALWTFEAQEFLPHVRVPGPAAGLAPRTPIWLSTAAAPEAAAPPAPPVLVNLGAAPPADAEAFERVIEIVSDDAQERAEGRQRWRHYEGWGVKPVHHQAAA
jgi:DNA polymerase-3 subunit chi